VDGGKRGFLHEFSTEGIKDLRKREGAVKDIIRRIERDRMGQWLEQRIRESNYNDRYKNNTSIGMSDYLLKRGERGSQKIIARWRCGNEEEGCIEHIMSHTRIKIRLGEVLDERGKDEVMKWMKEVKRLRELHRRGIERVRECECG